jgi:hypothetical protein
MQRGLLFIGILFLFSFDGSRLIRVKISDNISVMLPKEFRQMDGLDFNERFPSVRAPLAAYTDEDRMVSFSVNISATQWPDNNLEIAQKFFKASLVNMFDRVDILNEGVSDINKKQFIFFEFESRMNGKSTSMELQSPVIEYTYIKYLVEPNRTLVFSFSCPRRMRPDWEVTARAIMSSIKVK